VIHFIHAFIPRHVAFWLGVKKKCISILCLLLDRHLILLVSVYCCDPVTCLVFVDVLGFRTMTVRLTHAVNNSEISCLVQGCYH
jgi:hypothetical protein